MDAKMIRVKQLGYDVEDFLNELIADFKGLTETYKLINLDIEKYIPKPFNDVNEIILDSVFYYKEEILTISFYSGKQPSFNFQQPGFHYNVVFEDAWQTEFFKRDKNGEINDIHILASPVSIVPEPPYLDFYGISMAFTIEEFEKALEDVKSIAYYMLQSQLPFNKLSKSKSDLAYLEAIALEFKMLLDTENLLEKDVELFLNENTEILEYTLNIESILEQPELENVIGKLPHDLKPDIIGLDTFHNRWIILDYKKHDKSLVKNMFKSRTGFRSEVNDLENQLEEYRKYFEEEAHRRYFEDRYGYTINKPYIVGLIGLIKTEEAQVLNELLERKVKWLDIYPYNLLLDRFIKEIERIRKYSLK